jgi:predicted anti-sigma-YlaC factor YlaD
MMAHDSYHLMISLALDGELDEAGRATLEQHVKNCAVCADMWEQMTLLDTMFGNTQQATPMPDFTANVMARVEVYETRRRWLPWFVALLTGSSLIAALSIALPILLLTLGVQGIVGQWTFVDVALMRAVQAFAFVMDGVLLAVELLGDWLTFLYGEPVALAVVLAALTLASTWIGILESMKISTAAQQAS